MSLRAHVALAILVALAIVGIIVLVRRRHLKAKYSLLWLSLGAVMVSSTGRRNGWGFGISPHC